MTKRSVDSQSYKKLTQWLKVNRTDQKISMRSLASKLNKSHSLVSKVENNKQRLDMLQFVNYCKGLNIDPHEGLDILLNEYV